MFSIKKEHLRKALALVSKAVAQRQQEEVIYRSVRVSTFKDGDENYVAFQTNGGYNSIATPGYPISNFKEEIDVLIECDRLITVVEKSTTETITFKKADEETVLVVANGENKFKIYPGNMLAEFPKYDEKKSLGELKIKDFSRACRMVVPFSTVDIHNERVVGLCLENGNLYATDEKKGMTVENLGVDFGSQLVFNPIISEMLNGFEDDNKINFYTGKLEGSDAFTHMVFVIEGFELYVLKYNNNYAVDFFDLVNNKCKEQNNNIISFGKTTLSQALGRVSIFADENDIISLTPQDKGCLIEAINEKTGERGSELVDAEITLEDKSLKDKKMYVALRNLQTIVETAPLEVIAIGFSDGFTVASVIGTDFICWLTQKDI